MVKVTDGVAVRLARAALLLAAMQQELAGNLATARMQLQRYVLGVKSFRADVGERRLQAYRLTAGARASLRSRIT
jgi:hypothetical protein